MSVSVRDVRNDPGCTVPDERDVKFIIPQAFEVTPTPVCPRASAMLVHADIRDYATALVTLDPEPLGRWRRVHGLSATSSGALAADPTDPTVHPPVRPLLDPEGDGQRRG